MADIGDGSVGASLAYNTLMQSGGLSWGEFVTNIAEANGIHDLTEPDIDELLWEHTAWPMADAAYIQRQLNELFANWKGMPPRD
jgi:hypothetical protein